VELVNGVLQTPAGQELPPGLSGALAAQTLFPMAARVEMRGEVGANELAALPDNDLSGIWRGIVTRLRAIAGYDTLIAAAYPGVPLDSIGIVQVANAIAAFETSEWVATESPYDRYLRGDTTALSPEAVRGAILFFGKARCSSCHRGELLTDQLPHNIGIPPLGPGLGGHADLGRAEVTGQAADRYAFRTPSLRNITLTSPYMHNGVYRTLEQVIQHYEQADSAASRVDPALIDPRLRGSLDQSPATLADLRSTLDSVVRRPFKLSDDDVADLVAFLFALTDPASNILTRDMPTSVPSGLPVFDR
jgi:cytochrome c peroxidase